MRTQVIFLLVAGCLLGSCKAPKKEPASSAEPVALSGSLNISGAYALEPLMAVWAAQFTEQNPGVQITVHGNGTGAGIDDLIAGRVDLAMVSRNLTPDEEALEFWDVMVAKEGVLPVINASNPHLAVLLERGITRDSLLAVFSGQRPVRWGDLTGTDDSRPVKVFIRGDESGAAEVWAEYLGVKLPELAGKPMQGDSGVVRAVLSEPLGIGFCNCHYAYADDGNIQAEGLRVLPLDVNRNGKIDDKENFYDKITNIQRAAYLGRFPHHLCRELTVLCREKPTDPVCREFVRWILTDGQKIAVQKGYSELRNCDIQELLKKF